jgi:hypothetical protein
MGSRHGALEDQGFRGDLATYNALLKAAMRAADAGAADAALAALRAARLAGDEITLNTAVKAFAYAGRLDRALQARLP